MSKSESRLEELPLERLKTEAERWVPYIAEERGDSFGNASRGLRDIVQRAYDLGIARSETGKRDAVIEEIAKAVEGATITYSGPDPGGVRDLRHLIVLSIRDLKAKP